MRAAILAVGSELLGTDRLDTNSLRLTALLSRYGVELRRKAVIGDSEEEVASELRSLVDRVDLVLVTGGLGPTADDVTREAVAAALGRSLYQDDEVLASLEQRFRALGWRMPEVNRRQAQVVDGAEILTNLRGTAPGLRLESGGCTLFLFPGVPNELEGLMVTALEPWLAARSGGVARETAVLKIAGLPESVVEERIAPAYEEFGREAITILASVGEIRLQATAEGPEPERRARLQAMVARLAELAGDAVYTIREEDTLESVVGNLLRAAGTTLTAAESCTGGLLSQRVTSIAGSSDYFLGGAVTYSNELKTKLVGVPAAMLAEHGAVSEPVARAMAEGVRTHLGSDWGVGITGVSGPGGGTPEKPVGTVHVAVAGPRDGEVEHRRLRLPGDRERIRQFSAQIALEMLRRRLLAASLSSAATAERTPTP
ncbi:MAG TPA: competence/damage-inducible protein A [Thermoanaerobaculia bacterium]|jgi:nicotinamide-nucleotide amidase|nr:competence/damage-inducible protein A [Thermoanaerobaculia bacterium]